MGHTKILLLRVLRSRRTRLPFEKFALAWRSCPFQGRMACFWVVLAWRKGRRNQVIKSAVEVPCIGSCVEHALFRGSSAINGQCAYNNFASGILSARNLSCFP